MTEKTLENTDIERSSGAKKEQIRPVFETKISKLQEQEAQEKQSNEAELKQLEQKIDQTQPQKANMETSNPTKPQLDTETQRTIESLNRPQAQEGLKASYATIQQDIAQSDQDKNPIARALGKTIKRIL